MTNKKNQIIIEKALAFMRDNLAEALSIPAIARNIGYSPVYLRTLFRKATGKGILPHLLDLRIGKAQSLLRNSRLPVGEIALESGFNSHKQFTTLFRKKIGCSPTEFRASLQQAAGKVQSNVAVTEPWLSESFRGSKLPSTFIPRNGTWTQEHGYISGTSTETATLVFAKPLPENFRLSFEMELTSIGPVAAAELDIFLQDPSTGAQYSVFALGAFGGMTGEFRPHGFGYQQNPDAVFKNNRWYLVALELNDDTIRLRVDEKLMFQHKDPFPPAYARRSQLVLETYGDQIHIRNFVAHDLGFLPLVKSVRQGDSLYSAGLFGSARDFYTRLLASDVSTSDALELQYKIGRCFFRLEDFAQARRSMEKVKAAPETVYWSEQARLTVLEMDLLENLPRIDRDIAALFDREALRHGVREIVAQAGASFINRGFYDNALLLFDLMFRMEKPQTHASFTAESRVAETLMMLRRFEEAQRHFRAMADDPRIPIAARSTTLFSLCDNYGLQGDHESWDNTLQQLEAMAGNHPYTACRILAYRAIRHRAAMDFDAALHALSRLHAQFPLLTSWRVFSYLLEALILCCQGKVTEARKVLETAHGLDPGDRWLSKGRRSWSHYPVELAACEYEKAARMLLEDSLARQDNHEGAEFAIKAGILLALAGKDADSITTWNKAADRYIETRFNFYGRFAQRLAQGQDSGVEAMPYPAEKRSEMFYLVALLCEKRGQAERANELMDLCVREDRLLHWPAFRAGQWLNARRLDSGAEKPYLKA